MNKIIVSRLHFLHNFSNKNNPKCRRANHKNREQTTLSSTSKGKQEQRYEDASSWFRSYKKEPYKLAEGRTKLVLLLLGSLIVLLASGLPAYEAKTHHSKRQTPISDGSSPSGRESSNWWNVWWQQYINEAELPTIRPIISVSFRGRNIGAQHEQQQLITSEADLAGELDDNQDDVTANLVLANNRAQAQLANELGGRPVNERQRLIASSIESPRAPNKQMLLAQRKSMQHHYNWQAVKPTYIQSGNRQPVDDSPLGIQMRRTMRLQQQQQQQQQQQFEQRFEEQHQQQQHQLMDYNEDSEPEMINQLNNSSNNNNMDDELGTDMGRPRDSSSSSMMTGEGADTGTRTTGFAVAGKSTSMQETQPETGRPEAGKSGDSSTSNTALEGRMGSEKAMTQSGLATSTQTAIASAQATTASSDTSSLFKETTGTTSNPATTSQAPSTTTSTPASTTAVEASITTTTTTVFVPTMPARTDESEASGGQSTQSTTMGAIASETSTAQPGTRITPPNGAVQLENGRPATTTITESPQPVSMIMNRFPPRVMTITTPQQVDQQTTPVMSTITIAPSTLVPTITAITTGRPDEVVTSTRLPANNLNNGTSSVEVVSTTKSAPVDVAATTTTMASSANTSANGGSPNEGDATDGDEDDAENEGDVADDEENSATTTSPASTAKSEGSTSLSSVSMGERESSLPTGQQSTSASTTLEMSTTSQPILPTIDLERIPKTSSTQANSKSTTQTTMPAETPITSSTLPQSTQNTQNLFTTGEDIARITRPSTVSLTSPDDNASSTGTLSMTTLSRNPMEDETAITLPMDALMKMMMNQVADDNERAKLQQQINTSGITKASVIGQTSMQADANPTTPSMMTVRPTDETNPSSTMSTTPAAVRETGNFEQSAGITSATDDNLRLTTKSHLQPPPTTKEPSPQTTNNFMGGAETFMTTLSESPPQRTVTVNLSPPMTSSDEMSGADGREPKIEMVDLDLMPIQRIMSQNQDQNQLIMVPIGRLMERPSENNNEDVEQINPSTSSNMADGRIDQQQRLTTGEVEPGMRLRPPKIPMGPTKTFMTPIVMRSQQQNRQPAEPVYMIMLNNNSQLPNTTTVLADLNTQTKKPAPPSPTMIMRTTKPIDISDGLAPTRTTPGMMVMMMQRQQQQQQIQRQNLMANKPLMTTVIASDTKTSEPTTPLFMRTTQPVPAQQATKTTISDISTTRQQQFMTTTQEPQTVKQQQSESTQRDRDGELESKQITGSVATDAPSTVNSEMTTTISSNTLLITDPPASIPEQAAVSTTRAPSTPSTTTELERFVTTPESNYFNQQGSSPTPNPTTLVTTSKFDASPTMSTGSNSNTDLTTTKSTTLVRPINQSLTGSTLGSTLIPESKQTTTKNSLTKTEKAVQEAAEKTPIIEKFSIKGAHTISRQGKQQFSGTSSFIPPKLRADFGVQRLNANSTVPPMNAAIRQFGGANRMSVLGNQPVPFGRPAAKTLPTRNQQPQGQLQQSNHRLFEQPTFEYGPSIVVRRPDEPLANGQMPNCTLTGKNFCVLTKDYPMNEVRQAVERSFRSVRIMYEELQTVSDQELHKDQFNTTNNQAASGKFACQTQVEMMRPGWAKDEITREWMLVVNTDVFPQRVRTESCAQPNTPCEFIAPFYDSTCQQRYSLHRMIAIDPHDPSRSPQVAVFRFPAGCVCRVHPIRKTTTTSNANLATTSAPMTSISSSQTSKNLKRRR